MSRFLLAITVSSSLLLTPAGRSALLGGLQALLSPAGGPASKAGCRFDPNGRCIPATLDEGCGADPNGCSSGS